MDLRRERSTANRVIGMLLLTVLLAAGTIGLLWASRMQPAVALPAVEGQDARAVDGKVSLLAKKNKEDEFDYRINSKLVYPTWDAQGELKAENSSANRYLMAVELVRNDTGEVIFRSGYLQPGQRLEQAALDEPLTAGEYAVTAYLCAVDAQSHDLLGIMEQAVSLTVQK